MKNVLIVYGEATTREYWGKFLRPAGYDVSNAPDVETALLIMEEIRDLELIIIERELPHTGCKGIVLMAKDRFKPIQTIVVSSFSDMCNFDEARLVGAQDIIHKNDVILKLRELGLIK